MQATAALEHLDERPLAGPDLVALLETLVYLAVSRPAANLPSLNEALLEKYFSPEQSKILSLHPSFSARQPRLRSHSRKWTDEDVVVSELVSRLHSLSTPSLAAVASPTVRTAAKEIVYERLNFAKSSGYGPLKSDGTTTVDHRKVEAIQIVMSANLEEAKTMGWGQGAPAAGRGEETSVPSGWSSTRTGSAETPELIDGKKVDPRDWAGVTTHEWRGTYAFLHYPIYHAFNHHRTNSYIPSLAEESEAVGDCMSLKLELLPEGTEVTPPMEAFRTTPRANRPRFGVRAGADATLDSSDEDDSDFDVEAVQDDADEGSSASSSSDSETDLHTHFVTNGQQPRRHHHTPPTSPPDDADPVPPIGPLPPPSTSTKSRGSPGTKADASSFPKLAFKGTSMPLHLRTLAFTGTFVNSQSHFNIRDRSIRGTVEMNEAGEIIWKYIIRYGGIDHWAM